MQRPSLEKYLSKQQKQIFDCVSERGELSFLTAISLKKLDSYLNQQLFTDIIYLHYNITLKNHSEI